jgi:anti-anti-sigma factor
MSFGLSIDIQQEADGKAIIHLTGTLTSNSVRVLRQQLGILLDDGYKNLELDLTGLAYLDSVGVSEFIPIHQQVIQAGGNLFLMHPRRLIRHILVSAHINDLIEIGPPQDSDETSTADPLTS